MANVIQADLIHRRLRLEYATVLWKVIGGAPWRPLW